MEEIAFAAGAVLYGQNGNGLIDDGSEMFGLVRQRLQELSMYDADGNNWIDETTSSTETAHMDG